LYDLDSLDLNIVHRLTDSQYHFSIKVMDFKIYYFVINFIIIEFKT